jgi:hypothetical protein
VPGFGFEEAFEAIVSDMERIIHEKSTDKEKGTE